MDTILCGTHCAHDSGGSAPTPYADEVFWFSPELDADNNGTTVLADLTGNGHDGTLVGSGSQISWSSDAGAGGGAVIDFNGGYVDIPDGILGTGDRTVTGWGYTTASSIRVLFGSNYFGGVTRQFFGKNGANHFYNAGVGAGGVNVSPGAGASTGVWNFYAIRVSAADGASLSVNGVTLHADASVTPGDSGVGLALGSANQSFHAWNWIGQGGDWRGFPRALSDAELGELGQYRGFQP